MQNTIHLRYFSESKINEEIIIEDNEVKEIKDKMSN
jgi:hypothetical protein